jgi:hypothetical protein
VLQQNDRIISLAVMWRDPGLRAGFAISSETFQPILTIVALQSQAELAQRFEQRHEQRSSFSQSIFDVRRVAPEVCSFN